ncbi:VCBS domain-containing protein [Variovorax sp. J22R133]|uniref:VCBS domain-containing protein n=1 Tax=Variovorax brevis TaxID=3053503 RepID=UPI00257683E9|nr:VCBS domain-containing protein [Variovorax sp. J22R133]MDM0110600.1 VCBS domain-containing protein [Variovorax sp. J22R133]
MRLPAREVVCVDYAEEGRLTMGILAALIDGIGRLGGVAFDKPAPSSRDAFKPQRQAMALEPRIMFDGAAASAADQHHNNDPAQAADSAAEHPATPPRAVGEPAAATAAPAPAPAHTLLVVDSRIEQSQSLTATPPAGVSVLVVKPGEDGLAAISAALKQLGQVDSIQILSHGAAGQFTLGSQTVSSDNVDQLAPVLESWHVSLKPGADIQLYGCDVGAGPTGQILVNELAHWTGADVAASRDATGSASAGGNWTLETSVGVIDKPIALSAGTLASFDGLLDNASPTVTLSSAGTDVLLGGQFSFTASFTNPSSQVGFAPFIDVFLPATGKDGDDGATFVSATYLGQAIKTYTVTFDANGDATHPLAKDITGAAVVLHAANFGMRAGDQLIVLQLPNASITQGQPSVDIVVTGRLSNLADTTASDPAPDLLIRARGGFQFGNESADDPTLDPTLIEAGTHNFNIHPTVVSLSQSVPMTDGQTVTGPNYPHTINVTASAAAGQTVTDVVISQDVPNNILVTGIAPGAGGVLSSITTSTGAVLTAPGDIQAAFTAGDYITNYTITYATLTGTAVSTVTFYVPEVDANGVPVIDPVSGAPVTITVAPPEASASWTPLDPRDVASGTITASGTGGSASFTAQPLALYKEAVVTTNVGSPAPTPGDTLTYTIQVNMSDYFAFGENVLTEGGFTGVDELSDGQTFVAGSGVLSYTVGGVTKTAAMVSTVTPHPDGTTTLTLDIGQTLRNAGETSGALAGDLAFDPVRDGATTMTITYRTIIGQNITVPNPDPINEGDSVGNNATISATLLEDRVNLTGGSATDSDTTGTEVTPSRVDIEIVDVNGSLPPGTVELHPGDIVTFQISYDLVTGDYEQFILTGYLPLPLFDLSAVTWAGGTGVGQYVLGPGHTSPDTLSSVTNGAGNSIVFDFGDNDNPGVNGSRIEVRFTLKVSDTPFGDQRSVTAQAQSDQLTTIDQTHLLSQDAVVIQSVAEPVLGISHGVVSSTGGSITGTTGTWAAPGSSGVPFTGSVTDLLAVNGDIQGFDGGDTLRLATAIENTGGGGAFDVTTSITLPVGLSFVGGALTDTIKVYRGDGTQLLLGTDFSVTGNTVTFLDPVGFPSLLPGRAGSAGDTSGANLVVITYDVVVDAAIATSSTLQSTATLSNYAGANGGGDFTPADLTEVALEQVGVPTITKVFAGGTLDDTDSSSASTTGADVVIGETMLYDIVVTMPEGTALNLRVDDLVPPGMSLDTSFNGIGYQLITTAAGSGALTADFNGTLTIGSVAGVGGTAGADGVDARMTFTANSTAADNVIGNNSFVIRVRLIADNVIANQAGTTLVNNTQLVYSDPDSDTPNGTTPIERVIARGGAQPTATVREPTLTVTQSTNALPPLGVDFGDAVEYTITISNGSSASDFDAYDISLNDVLPAQLNGLTLAGVTYAGGATNNGGSDFAIVGGVLQSVSGANIDIVKGGSIVLRVTGTVSATAQNVPSIDNTATVQWTSLNGADSTAQAGERTGVDGPLSGGTLNNYQNAGSIRIEVLNGVELSRVGGLVDTPISPEGTAGLDEQVAIGEIVRYRVVSAIGEGETNDYRIQVTLDPGLQFLNDGTVKLAFISTSGAIIGAPGLTTGGTLNVVGSRNSAIAQPITPDLSGAAPDATIDPSRFTVGTDANGRTVITFFLGTVINPDQDADLEGLTIEFSARVANVASNRGNPASQLGATATHLVGAVDVRSVGETLFESVVEPGFNGVVKQVDSFTPNATATTSHADVSVRFTQNGTAPAYNVQLVDGFAGATGFTPVSVSIGGTVYTPGTLPPGVTFTSGPGGVAVTFDRLDPGVAVIVLYSVDVPTNAAFANTDATLTWSSLPENFTTWGGSVVGGDGTAQGERIGTGTAPNTYVLSEGAGLGLITGTLWDDSNSATTSTTPDGLALAGQTVTLTYAGADGDLATTADNKTFTATTSATGVFNFSALAAGQFRIDAPGVVTLAQPVGELRVRIDTDTATPLGQMVADVGEGATGVANVGYVQRNDAPVNTVPGTQNGLEDVLLPIAAISIADVDAGTGLLDVTLTVTRGVLDLSQATTGVTATGNGSATMTLSGTLADLNIALGRVTYLGALNFNGNDTLTVLTRDRGNFGDADGDGIPAEPVEDQLQDSDVLQIVLEPVNDPPQSVPDVANATEAGGPFNGTPGVNPTGNMLDNDLDVDIATNADTLHLLTVKSIATGITATPTPTGTVDLAGQYGTLSFSLNGGYTYTIDNGNPLVQALRATGQTLTESFEYTMTDVEGATDTATAAPTLTITILPANDTPVGVNDEGGAVEAGGVNNATAGSPAIGNVLTNDTDVDTVANGETKTVTGIRDVPEDDRGEITPVAAGGSTTIAGLYGSLQIFANGNYTYTPDNANPLVQGLNAGQTLEETFSYTVTDTGGLSDLANLHIVITGANDVPVAVDDAATAVEAGGVLNATPGTDPAGSVLTNDTDADTGDTKTVTEFRTGNEAGTGTAGIFGTELRGTYGWLTLNANGSYSYRLDNNQAEVQALRTSANTLVDNFSYTVTDAAVTSDRATLAITIQGADDAPVATDDAGTAIEAGGANNATVGAVAAGNVLTNDTDVDSPANGEVDVVGGIRSGTEAAGGALTAVAASGVTTIAGTYGSLQISAAGDYTYTLDDTNPAVQALQAGQTLDEFFTYQVNDVALLSDQAQLHITIQGRNDNPVAVDDAGTAVEAGGIANGTAGTDPAGNVLTNDTDIDTADTKTVTGFRTGTETGTGTDGTIGTPLLGAYGTLTLNANGSYTYAVNNTLPAVQALRLSTDTLVDNFSYTVADSQAATDRATLAITIQGANDTPVAVNDTADAIEAGGIANGTPGLNPTGNVITSNDSDVDANGEVLSIASFTEGATAGTVGTAFTSTYGSLLLNADGSYTYTVDNNNAAVQALRLPTDTLTEVFTYTLRDAVGATTTATLTVTIHGADDTPAAVDDTADAIETGGIANGTVGDDPTGNVLTNDSDVDAPANGEALAVSSVRTGTEAAGTGTAGILGPELRGSFGWLTLNADGSYGYRVDNNQAEVQALRLSTDTLTDSFSYTTADTSGVTDRATLTITIHGANDTPVAVNDTAVSIEAGGIANGTAGTNPSGNVITSNDSDVDSPANGEVLSIASYTEGAAAGTVGTAFTTTYGSLLLNADGSYTYTLDNNNAAVQALRQPTDTLTEVFTYTLRDTAGATTTATLTVTIQGTNDTPVATDDTATAVEAGGIANGTVGTNPGGNVLTNDTDVDGGAASPIDYGETQAVSSVRTGTEAGTGTAGTLGTALVGAYGSLTLNADGSWTYVVDNTLPAVQALRQATDTLVDNFSYTVIDTAGATDRATLAITIQGANDTPVAVNDTADAVEAGGIANGTPGVNPTGNVITANDSDVDASGEALSIAGYTLGATNGTLGTPLTTTYGSFTLNADGSYAYTVDNNNAAVQALRTPTDTLTEVFTYTLQDALGATSTATLTVTISGRDDTPVAADDAATAVEAGGVNNGTPGTDPTGNVLTNDTDVDGGAAGPIDYGETKAVSTVRTGTEAGVGVAGTLGTELRGEFGWLTLNADGSYTYRVDNDMAAVQALRTGGNTLIDNFSYTVADTAAATDRATLVITIQGADDTPGAVDDNALAIEAGGIANGTPGLNPSGNVLANDGDVDTNGETLSIAGFRQGLTVGTLGSPFAGAYGTLVLNADGTYNYTVNNDNATVQALRVPGETLSEVFTYTLQDALGATSTAALTVTIAGRNDTPIAVGDLLLAREAGGHFNTTPGVDPSGNLLGNDTDVDAGDSKTLDGIRTGAEADGGAFTDVTGTMVTTGQYGSLTVNPDGSFYYAVNNDAFLVQRMRQGDTLTETFTYRMHDTEGASDVAQVTVVINGAWDAPVARADFDFAVPALLFAPGVDATGNVLANDSDVDRDDVDIGTGIRPGADIDPLLSFLSVAPGTDRVNGAVLVGQYGELIIGSNGDYVYRVNPFNPVVLALLPGETVLEEFAYRITDLGGLDGVSLLTIVVRGRNNAPFPTADTATAIEAGGLDNATGGVNPSGNVIDNDTEFDGDILSITGFRTGERTGTGTEGTVGGSLRGLYGDLTLNADGSWTYVVDNTLPQVQALRVSGQTLTDVFTYTDSDPLGMSNASTLTITVDGNNDTPIATDDNAIAVEAGGVANATPGTDPTGNVLDNDTDVDSVANGETKQVEVFANSAGSQAAAGQSLAGLYGRLTLRADGSYGYVVDNDNAAVQALRTGDETLTEVFTYRMVDAAGATSMARLTVVVRGADDNPIAADDSNVATDQVVAPQASGRVLPNDRDIDGGDAFQVTAIREGTEAGTGAAGTVGQPSAGRYGTLVINPDGSYTYSIDLSNPQVLAAAGFGPVLQDVFTYTITDRTGGTDQAQLLITLDISAPFIQAGGGDQRFLGDRPAEDAVQTLGFVPGIFVRPVVERDAVLAAAERKDLDGSHVELVFDRGIHSTSIGAGLGRVGEQFVHDAVFASQVNSRLDLAQFLTRHGRTSLSVDGLLSDPSVFSGTNQDLTLGPAQRGSNGDLGAAADPEDAGDVQTASPFTEQLKMASQRLTPFWYP